MNTINIAGRTLNVSDELSVALMELNAYFELPAAVKDRIDPKQKRSDWLYEVATAALNTAFGDDVPEQFEEECIDWVQSAVEQHCV